MFSELQLDREGIKEREDGERGGGDHSREAIILNISIKGGGAIMRGRRLIEGRLLFEEMRCMYHHFVLRSLCKSPKT